MQRRARSVQVESLETRMLLSGTLKTIAAFNGANGFSPAAVVEDANKNLFGVTMFIDTGADNVQSGEIFEVPAGTNTINVLAKFDTPVNGLISPVSLVIDSSGNLFGTENDPNGDGKIFELAAGSGTITTVASFPDRLQVTTVGSQGRLTAVDSAGNLFGVDSLGNAFEVVKGSGTISNLAATYGSLGSLTDLQLGPDGNLYGTLPRSVIQIVPSTKQLTVLASLDDATTGDAPTGITFDSAGNIWGFSNMGGAGGNGAVWELPVGGSAISLISSFTSDTGSTPVCRPVFGSDGNLYGITSRGGTNDNGSLFDIPAGASAASATAPIKLVDFDAVEQVPDTGSGIVANGAGIAVGVTADHDIPFFGALFSSTPTATASAQEFHHDISGTFGAILEFVAFVLTPPGNLSPPLDPELQKDEEDVEILNEAIKQALAKSIVRAEPALKAAVAGRDVFSAVPLRATAKQLAPIRKSIATIRRQLRAAAVQVHKQDAAAAQFTKEGKAITALQAQLAKAKTAAKAALQKKINADTALQTKYLNQDHSIYAVAKAQLTTIETEESTVAGQISAL